MPNIRKPTALKELAGNPGKRKLNRNEPKPKGGPVPPDILSAAALAVWQRLVASMPGGVYTDADHGLLAAYCVAVANHQEATLALKSQPQMVTGSTGQPVVNPLFKHQGEQARLIVTLGARLGLDPVARQSLSTEAVDAEEDKFGIH